jgi:hypothetical protein
MKNDFPTAPLASSLRGAGGGTVEKSFTASHTKIQTPPSFQIFISCNGMRRSTKHRIPLANTSSLLRRMLTFE